MLQIDYLPVLHKLIFFRPKSTTHGEIRTKLYKCAGVASFALREVLSQHKKLSVLKDSLQS